MALSRLFVVHGFMAGPDYHWFGWLKEEAQKLGLEVCIPAMPAGEAPDVEAWVATLKEQVGRVDEHTWFVGHSLGCITLLRYLAGLDEKPHAGGTILVSGFSEPVARLPELDCFSAGPLALSALAARLGQCAVVLSLNDDIVPPAHTLHLAQQLGAPLYGLPDSGHFLERDGVVTFPLVLRLLREWMSVTGNCAETALRK